MGIIRCESFASMPGRKTQLDNEVLEERRGSRAFTTRIVTPARRRSCAMERFTYTLAIKGLPSRYERQDSLDQPRTEISAVHATAAARRWSMAAHLQLRWRQRSVRGSARRGDRRNAMETPRSLDHFKRFSFCTPLAIEVKGTTQVVLPASGGVAAYDPKTGAEIWKVEYDGYSVIRGRLRPRHGLVSSGYDSPTLYAIRVDAKATSPKHTLLGS